MFPSVQVISDDENSAAYAPPDTSESKSAVDSHEIRT